MWPFKHKNFYQSADWIEIRNWAIKKYGAKCQKCGSAQDIQCDHRLPRSIFPKHALNKYNVGILCGPCNREKAAKIEKDYRPLSVKFRWLIYLVTQCVPRLVAIALYLYLLFYLLSEDL